MTHEKLPRVKFATERAPSMWVDESIWGHRLYDEQTPWLTFLELLNVLYSEDKEGRGFKEEQFNSLSYKPRRLLHLRNIVFNNPKLKVILSEFADDEVRWRQWLGEMDKVRGGIESSFSCVKSRFDSFEHFCEVVEILRATSIEGASNKQFTSKFIFPYGPDCLFEDLDARNFIPGRRFFARTGELAYLMLCRSSHSEEILENLRPIVLDPGIKWNQLVRCLHSGEEENVSFHRHAYLPYKHLEDFDLLAKDWLDLLKCRLPGYDVLPHLVCVLGLHMLLYFLRRAKEHTDDSPDMTIVCEIISPKKTVVRELADQSYKMNNFLSRDAVTTYIDRVRDSEEWKRILVQPDCDNRAKDFLEDYFMWKPEAAAEPEFLLNMLREDAIRRHAQHVAKIHASWARSLGLASRRGTRSIRYAPTDSLLKSLVYTVVDGRMELHKFLEELYRRYGFVIGYVQAEEDSLIGSNKGDIQAFRENTQRLEMRLVSLGLLKRLSDACAYVLNPYFVGAECQS